MICLLERGISMSIDMTAQEIKDIRGKYQMSRKTFSQLLGIGEASLARYESGGKPTKANANLIRAAENPRFMADCLKRDGVALPDKQRAKAEQIVYSMVYFVEAGEIMDMTDMYLLTLEQEILNEHAASVMADIDRLAEEAEDSGDETLSLVLNDMALYIAQAKFEITGKEGRSKESLVKIRAQIDSVHDIALRCVARAA